MQNASTLPSRWSSGSRISAGRIRETAVHRNVHRILIADVLASALSRRGTQHRLPRSVCRGFRQSSFSLPLASVVFSHAILCRKQVSPNLFHNNGCYYYEVRMVCLSFCELHKEPAITVTTTRRSGISRISFMLPNTKSL